MGKCRICGKSAGLFRSVHKECLNKPIVKYVASLKSKKYHHPTCRFAKGNDVENLYSFTEVLDKEYTACKICKPYPSYTKPMKEV